MQPEEQKDPAGSGNREDELITKINTLFSSSVSSLVSLLQSLSCMNTSEALFSSFECVVYVLLKIKVRRALRASRGLRSKVFLRQSRLAVVKARQQDMNYNLQADEEVES